MQILYVALCPSLICLSLPSHQDITSFMYARSPAMLVLVLYILKLHFEPVSKPYVVNPVSWFVLTNNFKSGSLKADVHEPSVVVDLDWPLSSSAYFCSILYLHQQALVCLFHQWLAPAILPPIYRGSNSCQRGQFRQPWQPGLFSTQGRSISSTRSVVLPLFLHQLFLCFAFASSSSVTLWSSPKGLCWK